MLINEDHTHGAPSGSGDFGEPFPGLTPDAALDIAMLRLEDIDMRARQLESERMQALAGIRELALRATESTLTRAKPTASFDTASFDGSLAYRSVRAEVATALHLSEQTVGRHLDDAVLVVEKYPETLRALSRGAISARHVSAIIDAGAVIGELGQDDTAEIAAQRADYEGRAITYGATTTPNRLRPYAKQIAEEYAFESLDERYERECRFRSVWVTEREDGMAELCAYLPAHEAYGIFSRLTAYAKRIEHTESGSQAPSRSEPTVGGEVSAKLPTRRLRNEIRADLLSDLLLREALAGAADDGTANDGAGPPSLRGIVQVITHGEQLTVQAPKLPLPIPLLEGYGPIPVSVARTISGEAESWDTVTVEPTTGTVLSVDRYRPSGAMRRFLLARDQHCRFPGCRIPAHRCDLDHTVDAALGGSTSTDNLGALCRSHHTLKHQSEWKVKQHQNGDYEWTSPTGRTHIDRPAHRVRFEPTGDPPGEPPADTFP